MSLVTLVRPLTVVPKWAHTSPICPPIGVASVASAVQEAGYRVAIVSALVEAVPETRAVDGRPGGLTRGLSVEAIAGRLDPETTYIGLSCMFSHEWPMTRIVINELRKALPNAAIIEFRQKIIERGHRFTWQLPSGNRSETIDRRVAVEERPGSRKGSSVNFREATDIGCHPANRDTRVASIHTLMPWPSTRMALKQLLPDPLPPARIGLVRGIWVSRRLSTHSRGQTRQRLAHRGRRHNQQAFIGRRLRACSPELRNSVTLPWPVGALRRPAKAVSP